MPTKYVGVRKLDVHKYSYRINATISGKRMSLECRKDRLTGEPFRTAKQAHDARLVHLNDLKECVERGELPIKSQAEKAIVHFGVTVRKVKYSLKLIRDEFAIINTKPSLSKFSSLAERGAYTDESGREYTREWCESYRNICLGYFDSTIQRLNRLSRDEFNTSIDDYLNRHSEFQPVSDISKLDCVEGYYMLVLDEYKQVYIGKSENIKRRIQQHWSKTKPFDRTLFPMYNTDSVLSIDFFRALDTTRIYVFKAAVKIGVETILIDDFPRKFSCNRICGDAEITGIPIVLDRE